MYMRGIDIFFCKTKIIFPVSFSQLGKLLMNISLNKYLRFLQNGDYFSFSFRVSEGEKHILMDSSIVIGINVFGFTPVLLGVGFK